MSVESAARATVDGQVIPDSIKDDRLWTVWDMDSKVPLAPWNTGTMYPVEWAEGMSGDRPERTYEKAQMVAELSLQQIHDVWPFPRDDYGDPEYPEDVRPAILLPHTPECIWDDKCLMYIDFDDVRDPNTNEITNEVQDILDRLDSYTEVSSSGEGLHVLVWTDEGLPDGRGKVVEDLNNRGGIEMYDHSRFYGATWEHVEGTPTEIHNRQDVVNELCDEYDPDAADTPDTPEEAAREVGLTGSDNLDSGGSSGLRRNAYYQLDTQSIAEQDPTYNRYADDSNQGPHPAHGATEHDDSESTNFNLHDDGSWYCFACDSAGGPLDLIATMESINVTCDDVSKRPLENNPEKMLAACLYARDKYTGEPLYGKTPPYTALVAVADRMGFEFADRDKRILTSDAKRLAEKVYQMMGVEDI